MKVVNDYEKCDNNGYYVDYGFEGINIICDNDGFFEEMVVEIVEFYCVVDCSNDWDNDCSGGNVNEGWGIGYIVLVLFIILLFVLFVLLGVVGIIVGYIVRRRGV